jgi:hypothetical protein
MARMCGICRRAPREDDPMSCLRLHSDDVKGLKLAPGLYQACVECIEQFTPVMRARMIKTQPIPDFEVTSDTVLTPHQLM